VEKDHIDSICTEYKIKNYTINSDGSIDVDGNVKFSKGLLTTLPLRFGKVSGDFYCSNNDLSSLVGGPSSVGGNFQCYNNQLSTLEGAPVTVGGDFSCMYSILTSLEGAPTTVGGDFYCHFNQITSLEGAPTVVVGDFSCQRNKLSSTYTGYADLEIGGAVYLHGNNLPLQFDDNHDHIPLVLKYQRHFEIWNEDLTLNVNNFNDLITEIKDGLK